MVAKQIRGELLKIFSELGFLTLSSVLLLLKVSFLEIFLQWLYCALYVCMWGGAHVLRCTHINAYTHALCTQRTHIHMHPHMCTLGCVCTHIQTQMYTHVQVHTNTCTHTCETHDFTAEVTGAFPGGEAFYYSAYFPSLQWEITQNLKNHSLRPQMDGWSTPGAPGNSFHPAGVCNSVESWCTASFTDLWLGFVAVGGCNLLGLRFIMLSVQEDVIYLPGGTTFAPKKMFSLPWLTFTFKK